MVAIAPAATATTEAFDSPGVLAESVEMLRTIMRTSDKESTRLSAARTLANLAARFITRRPPPPSRDTDQPDDARGPTITTPAVAAPRTAASADSRAAPGDTASPAHSAPSTRPRRVSPSRRAAGTPSDHAPTPPRRFVTAIPPLIDKHYPAPNAVLDPLFDILASPIPTDPMTEAELDDLQAIHVNLKREDLKNPRRAARWRHQLREDRFWKAYWQEWRKNPDEFKRCYEAFMNRKPAATPDATSTHEPASTSTSPNPSEPLASTNASTPPASGP